MMFPIINVRAVNVELTRERKDLIMHRLAPLARLVAESGDVNFDVVIRKMSRRFMGDKFCVSVRMTTPSNKFYAVAGEYYLNKSLSRVRDDLRRSISRDYRTEVNSFAAVKDLFREQQLKELLA